MDRRDDCLNCALAERLEDASALVVFSVFAGVALTAGAVALGVASGLYRAWTWLRRPRA